MLRQMLHLKWLIINDVAPVAPFCPNTPAWPGYAMVFALPKALRKGPRRHSDEPIIVISPKIAIFIFIGDP